MNAGQIIIAIIASVLFIFLIIKIIIFFTSEKGNDETVFTPQDAQLVQNHSVKDEVKEEPDEVVYFDSARLLRFYEKKIYGHYKSGKSGILQCKIILCVQLLLSVIFCLNGDPYTILFLVNIVFIVWLGIRYYNQSNKPIDDGLAEGSYTHINRDQFVNLWKLSDDLLKKMGLDDFHLIIYYIKSNKAEIYVNEDNNTIHLYISGGFISFFDEKPKDIESILAHELGHIRQGDNQLFLINKSLISIPGTIIAIAMFINVIFIIYNSFHTHSTPQYIVGGVGAPFALTYIQLINKRKEAEYLADLASVVYVEGSTIIELIKHFLPDMYSINYPSKMERLIFIERTLEKFCV